MTAIRLDVVVKVKEREEERRLETFAQAQRREQLARQQVSLLETESRRESEPAGLAAHLSTQELARQRVLEQLEAARQRLAQETLALQRTRTDWSKAHQGAEAVRRVADARRAELTAERERAERKAFDELALLQFARAS